MFNRSSKPVVRGDVVLRQLEDDWVAYDPKDRLLHILNLPAVVVFEHCDGLTAVADIAERLHEMFEDPPSTDHALSDVMSILERFAEAGLLE